MSRTPRCLVLAFSILVSACGARGSLEDGLGGGGNGAGSGNGGTGATTSTGGGNGGTGATTGTGGGNGGTGATTSPGSGTSTGSGMSTGSGTSTGTGTVTEVCPSFGEECKECLSTACPERYSNCYENRYCIGLLECVELDQCNGYQGCESCYYYHQDGIADMMLLADCAATTCADACPECQGGALDPCDECMLESCEDEANTCIVYYSCIDFYHCLATCGDLDVYCKDFCYEEYLMSDTYVQSLLECVENACASACN